MSFEIFFKILKEFRSVIICCEDISSLNSSRSNMIESAGEFYPQRSCHAQIRVTYVFMSRPDPDNTLKN